MMKKIGQLALLSLAALLLAFATGCASMMAQPVNPKMLNSAVTVDKAVEGRPSVGLPISIKNSRVVMLPFELEKQKRWLEKDSYGVEPVLYESLPSAPYGGSIASRSYYGTPSSTRWQNVIFKNLDTGKEWLLLDKRGVITAHSIMGPVEEIDDKTVFTPVEILFRVTTQDTDGDGVLTSKDVTQVMAAGAEGENIRVVTPPGVDCVTYRWDHEVDELFMQLRGDTNGDGLFSTLDESMPYVLEPGAPRAVPVTTQGIREKADQILR